MRIEKLVHMANDISAFFGAEPDSSLAAHGVAEHLRKFWAPSMREQIIAHNREGGGGMTELVKAAVKLLDQDTSSATSSRWHAP